MLRYYDHETSAAKDLLYRFLQVRNSTKLNDSFRRQKALDLVDKRTRELEVARVKNRDIVGSERKLEVICWKLDFF